MVCLRQFKFLVVHELLHPKHKHRRASQSFQGNQTQDQQGHQENVILLTEWERVGGCHRSSLPYDDCEITFLLKSSNRCNTTNMCYPGVGKFQVSVKVTNEAKEVLSKKSLASTEVASDAQTRN